jgi:hypothetical protein
MTRCRVLCREYIRAIAVLAVAQFGAAHAHGQGVPAAEPVPEIRDIAPPVDVLPYPPWMVAAFIAVTVVIACAVAWLFVRWWKRRAPAAHPSARAIALRELNELRSSASSAEPYAFSITVSDILRRFIAGHFGLHAERQTSPEVLAAIAESPKFSDAERELLSRFLEKCDLIKFARIDANPEDNEELVTRAVAFVQGAAL